MLKLSSFLIWCCFFIFVIIVRILSGYFLMTEEEKAVTLVEQAEADLTVTA